MSTTTRKRKPTPAVHVLTRNILATLAEATADEIEAGRTWYAEAHALAIELANTGTGTGTPNAIRRAAGVIAALSPQVSWTRNAVMAREIYATGTTRGLRSNVEKARKIYSGADPDDVLGGNKVRAFFANIADPESSPAVTVDRHAYDVARGRRGTDADRADLALPRVYGAFVAAYERAAFASGLTPLQVQAATWVAWRRIHGITA
jgi:hypothetical protein